MKTSEKRRSRMHNAFFEYVYTYIPGARDPKEMNFLSLSTFCAQCWSGAAGALQTESLPLRVYMCVRATKYP